jgi:hypothetical protein
LALAPASAFGTDGKGWLRWCFASHDPCRPIDGADRLAAHLGL